MENKFKSFLYVSLSSFIVLATGIVIAFIVPKYTHIDDYAYWQLFLLYSSYVGIAILGYNDGIYIDIGGYDKNSLDSNKYSTLHLTLFLYTILISLFIVSIIYFLDILIELKQILLGVLAVLIIQNLNSFFLLVNQATGRLKQHSVLLLLEKLSHLSFITIYILYSNLTFHKLIIFNILSKLLVLIFNYTLNSRFVFKKPNFSKEIMKEILKYLKLGLPLTLYGVFSMFMTGIGKFYVDKTYNIEIFAMYAFAFSAMAVVDQFISSFSLVMYPYLSNLKTSNINKFVKRFEKESILFCAIIFAIFYPIVFIINRWLDNYVLSINYILALYPMLVFKFKISGLYGVYFKTKKETGTMLFNVSITVSLLFIMILVAKYFELSAIYISIITVIGYFIWYIMYLISFRIKYNVKTIINVNELFIIAIFYYLNFNKLYLLSLIVMMGITILIFFINIDHYLNLLKNTYRNFRK